MKEYTVIALLTVFAVIALVGLIHSGIELVKNILKSREDSKTKYDPSHYYDNDDDYLNSNRL